MSEKTVFSGTKDETLDWFTKLIKRAEAGDETALPELREILSRAPGAANYMGGDLAKRAEQSLVNAIAGSNLAFRESLLCKLKALRAELAGSKQTAIERLLVERVVACWLHVQYADFRYAQAKDVTFEHGDFLQRQQDRSHCRFLSAVKTLAVVRRLALPIKVDVNVAGTLETGQSEPPEFTASRLSSTPSAN